MGDNVIFTNKGPEDQKPTNASQSPITSTEIPLNQLPHNLKAQGTPVKPSEPGKPSGPPPPPGRGFPGGFVVKIIIGLVVIGVLAFLIFGVAVPFFSRETGTEEEASLTYWGLWENENTMNVIIDEFEKNHPNITVQYIKQDPVKYTEKLKAQLGTETGPDIFRFHNTWVPLFKSDLLPLPQEVISAENFKDAYYPVIVDDLASEGPIYGIPLGIDTLALFINPEITRDFDVPKDWDEFSNVASSVTVINGAGEIETAGAALGTLENVNHAPDILSMMMVQGGADLYGEVDSARSQQAMASALEFYRSFARGQARVWDSSLEPSIEAFAKEKLAMYFGYSWDIFQIRSLNPELQFEVHPVPGLAGGESISVASYWVEGVSAKTPHQDAALKFMNFLSKKETLLKLYEAQAKTREFGELYPMTSLQELLAENTLVYPFVSQAENAQSTYFVSDTHDTTINRQMNGYLTGAIKTIIDENTSAETAVETLTNGITTIRQQYDF